MDKSFDIRSLGLSASELTECLDGLFVIYDAQYQPLYANKLAWKALPSFFGDIEAGLSVEEATHNIIRNQYPELPFQDIDNMAQSLFAMQRSGATYQFMGADNRLYAFRQQILDDTTILGFGLDVTQANQYQERLKSLATDNIKLANTDYLTGLSNRRHFLKKLDEKFEYAARHNEELYLAFLDLNGFKAINDTYGHETGDQLLKIVGERLIALQTDTCLVARLGGDEFALLSWKQVTNFDLLEYGRTICDAINQPCKLKKQHIRVSSSLGWARFPTDALSVKDLLKKSDFALFKSKDSNPTRPVLFDKSHEQLFHRQKQIISELEKDKIEDELHIHFQPIHDIKTNRIKGFEALARWTSPILGSASPLEFITFAEKSQRIKHLTPILLRKALETAETWPQAYTLHFNLSAIDICSQSVIKNLIKMVKASDFKPENLILEVTETEIIKSFKNVKGIQDALRDVGIKLYLDDFGSGYSNLNYINQINAAGLKIDKDFFPKDGLTSETIAILQSIQFLCKKLDLDLIIEGIEEEDQLRSLSKLDISNIQGYYFSKPMPPEDLPAYILNHRLRRGPKESNPYSRVQAQRVSA